MIETQITYFDLTVLGILALSCLFAFFRGFVKEILSLGAWVGAGLITLYFFPDVATAIKPHVKGSPVIAAGFATLGLYISSLLIFSMINAMILRFLKEGSDVGFLDNMLGLMFGLFRGAFIVSLGYLVLTVVFPDEDAQPEWMKTAKSREYVEEGALLLARAAPEYLQDITSLKDEMQKRKEAGEPPARVPLFRDEDSVNGRKQDNEMQQFLNSLEEEMP